jgi:proteasome lid subunit RPN8/RPN11
MPFRLQIPRSLWSQMLSQAIAELPNECCGLLAGRLVTENPAAPDKRLARVERCYPLVNAAASPREYLSAPEGMFAAVRDMDQLGLEIVAVYHSHPTSDPVPSRIDLERNYSPDIVNLIISLHAGEPKTGAWWLEEQSYREAEWEVVEGIQ